MANGSAYTRDGGKKGSERPTITGQAAGGHAARRLNPLFVEWLMGFPLGWTLAQPYADPWQAARLDRMDRLRCLGNAVVPATAELAIRTLAHELMEGG